MVPDGESVVFEAHPGSAVMRRMFWWLIPVMALPLAAAPFMASMPAVAWILIGCIPPVATIVMPRLIPLRVALDSEAMTFGSGISTRRIDYDRVLVVDLRKTAKEPDEKEDEKEDETGGHDADPAQIDNAIPDATERANGTVESKRATAAAASSPAGPVAESGTPESDDDQLVAATLKSLGEVWRVTVHANLVPVSVSLAADDATTLARALHQMCPRAALWDVDGCLVEPIDPALAAVSLARVKRMATTRRVLSIVGGFLSFGAFTLTFGGSSLPLGIVGQIMPYFWIGIGAGLLGMAAGAEKRLLMHSTVHDQGVDGVEGVEGDEGDYGGANGAGDAARIAPDDVPSHFGR